MDLKDIEPFTLIVWADGMLFQLVWDGAKKHRLRLDSEIPQLWSSSTLYKTAFGLHRIEIFKN